MSVLDEHLAALRAADDDCDDARTALATRLRLRRSLEVGHRIRRQVISVVTAVAILLLGTASWALVTGNLPRLWPRLHLETEPKIEINAPPVLPPLPRAAPVQRAMPPVLEPPPLEPYTVQPPPPPPMPRPRPAHPAASAPPPPAPPRVTDRSGRGLGPAPIEALYRKAHELHFRGGNYDAALAAWNAYLAAEPEGRFAVEARYNRALCLIRLGRLAEAKVALLPFERGDVEPAGYRREEAHALIEGIMRIGLNE